MDQETNGERITTTEGNGIELVIAPPQKVELPTKLDPELANRAQVLDILKYMSETTLEDGKHKYIPAVQDGYFPVLFDFTIGKDEPYSIPELKPDFKFTHNVIWRSCDNKPLLDEAEPFPDDEFDIRIYFMAYVLTVWRIHGDGTTPKTKDIETYISNLADYIYKCRDLTPEEINAGMKPENMFHARYPDNFVTKYVMSQMNPKEHPLYYQVINCALQKPDGTKIYCAYLPNAYMITPDKMILLKLLGYSGQKNEDGSPGINGSYYLGKYIYTCYDNILKFMSPLNNMPIRWPMFRF